MAIRPLRPDQQKVLIATLETATDLSDEIGPDAAIAKAAKQHGLPYGLLQYTVNAYNTGQSVSNIKSGSSREEKAADVPLATLEQVMAHLYPDQPVKKASISTDYHTRPADLFAVRTPTFRKQASIREALPLGNDIPDDKMMAAVQDVRDQLASVRSQTNQEFHLYKKAQRELQSYFDNVRHMRLSDVLEQSVSAFGDMAKVVLEPLSDNYETHKRASHNVLIRIDREPFLSVKKAITQLDKLYEMGLKCGQVEQQMRETLKSAKEQSPDSAHYIQSMERNIFGPNPKAAPVPVPEPVNKKAFFSGEALLNDLKSAPSEFAAYIKPRAAAAPAAPAAPKTPETPAKPMRPKVESGFLGAKQHAETSSLNKSVAINNLLASDPDLAGYDRGQVIRAYNEIQTAYPRVAANAATLRPYLQRHLTAGGLDEFALKNLADQEVRLSHSQNPNPQGAV